MGTVIPFFFVSFLMLPLGQPCFLSSVHRTHDYKGKQTDMQRKLGNISYTEVTSSHAHAESNRSKGKVKYTPDLISFLSFLPTILIKVGRAKV